MTQAAALDRTVVALKLRPEHTALVEAARRLAEVLDIDENAANASLWARYHDVILALLDTAPKAATDDGAATLLELVRPKIRNSKNAGTKVTGARRSRNRKVAGDPVDALAATGRQRRPGTPA